MKLLGNYLRDKKTIYLSWIGIFFIYYIIYRLYRVEREALLYAFIVSLILLLFIFVVDYKKYKRQVAQLDFILNNLQMGYINYLNDFDLKSEKYREIIVGFEEEYRSREGQLEDNLKAQGEFFMMWTHQVKLPISASKLILETEENINRRDLKLQLNRIDQYTDMVMAYIRLNSEDSDFVFEAVNIDKVIKACIKIFKIEFIHNNIKLKYSPLNKIVITDTKWFSFAVEQIVSNALKYTSEGEISIYIQGDKLIVQDTGMGISKGDLPRIFQKGYTGYNGRSTHKSSGLGLYLTKSVLDKLHHSIAIESEVNKGTKVSIGLERYEFKGE